MNKIAVNIVKKLFHFFKMRKTNSKLRLFFRITLTKLTTNFRKIDYKLNKIVVNIAKKRKPTIEQKYKKYTPIYEEKTYSKPT